MKLLHYELLQRIITALILSIFGIFIFFFLPPWCFSLVLVVVALYTVLLEMPRLIPFKPILFWLTLLCYPIASFFMLIILNHYQHYRMLIFISILAVCANDTGAYCSGKLWGKHKIWPAISPKKTWEGFFGGYFLTVFTLISFEILINKKIDLYFLIIISFLFALIGTAGDFFESWLKRKAKVKDSGTLLPGHGGLLDRFDSLLFVIFFVFFCKEWLAKKLL